MAPTSVLEPAQPASHPRDIGGFARPSFRFARLGLASPPLRSAWPEDGYLAIGFCLLAFGFWLLAFGYWLLAFGY